MRRIGLGLLCAGALAATPATASAASPCPHEWPFTQPNASKYKTVSIPSSATAIAATEFDGLVVRPKHLPAGVDRVPGVVLLHGRGGNKCALWWAARFLASRGYIALTLTYPEGDSQSNATAISVTAAQSGVKFLRSAQNPYRSVLRRNDLGLLGHSQGSSGVSVAQSGLPAVRAIVGFDNLRAYGVADPGGTGCIGPDEPVTPRVPALGLGSETGCQDDPALTDKLAGFHSWKAAGRRAMEIVLAGVKHDAYAGFAPFDAAHTTALRRAGYYTLNWFNRWLLGRRPAINRMLSPNVLGAPVDDVLSAMGGPFTSAAFLPGRIDCEDLRGCI